MFTEYDEVLNTDEACEALKIGLSTLYKLLKTGKLKGFKCGRAWKIPKIAIESYIKINLGMH